MEWRAKEPKMVTWVQSIKALLAVLKVGGKEGLGLNALTNATEHGWLLVLH